MTYPNRGQVTSMALAGLISAILSPVASYAAESAANSLEEIVVTAQRREERLQDVPISVSAYGQAALDSQSIRSIDDVSRLAPGVNFSHGTNYNSASSDIAIRGVQSSAGAATTGIYIDDTPIQTRHLSFGTFNAYPVLFDLGRVEVLRGPQGTLFGSGSEGGTVRFIMPEAQLTGESAYMRSELATTSHGDPSYEVGVAHGGAISEGVLGYRASVSYRRNGGYIDHVDYINQSVTDKASNWDSAVTARLALKWKVSDALTVSPSIYYQSSKLNDTSAFWEPVPGTDPTNGFLSPDKMRNGNRGRNPSDDKFTLSSVKVEYSADNLSFVSNTSYFVRRQSAYTDYTEFDRAVFLGDPYVTDPSVSAPTQWADDQDNFTQEFRLTKNDPSAALNWTVGVFYQHSKENTVENVYDPAILEQLGLPVGDGYIYKQNPFSAVDKQLAVFGQADYKLSPRVKATLGVRYSNAEFASDTYYSGFVVGPPVASKGTLKEHPVTPKLGINFQMTPDNLLYASAAKGFRVGGANPAIGIFCGLQPDANFNSDSVWSYEVGSKNQSADHKLMFDASGYVIKWKNVQQNVYLPCGFQFTDNLGNAESKGFDLAFSLKMSDAFSFGATVAYTDAAFTEDVLKTVSGQTLPIAQNGDHLAGAPWNFAFWGQANYGAFGGDGYFRVDFQHNAEQRDRTSEQNPSNYTYQLWRRGLPAVDNLSIRTGVNYGRLDVSAFVTNLTNSLPAITRNQDVGTPTGGTPLFYDITQRPRTFGVTATYRY